MLTVKQRHLPLAGTYNIRDLGGYPTLTGRTTQWRRLLRADSLHRLTGEDIEVLLAAGVTTVVDLRTAVELDAAPSPFGAFACINYVNISLFDGLALAAPAGALEDGSRDVLRDLYIQALAERQSAIREILTVIARAGRGAVIFHCTAGKDRTGLIAALILSIVDVDLDCIVEDYVLTKTHIVSLLDELISGAKARGVDMAGFTPLLACEPETMRATLDHIGDRYGSVLSYLALIGLDIDVIALLKARLVDETVEEGAF